MKKITLLAFAAIMVLGTSSCSKVRNCCCDGVCTPMDAATLYKQKKICEASILGISLTGCKVQ